jgi:hypothetical protein
MTHGRTESRHHLSELDPRLRLRVRRLDEPVSREDWTDVVARSHRLRFSVPRLRTAGFAAAAIAAGAVVVFAFVPWNTGTARASVPSRLAIQLSDGRQLVLVGHADQTLFVDETDDRDADSQVSPAVWRTLTAAGPFRINTSSLRQDRGSKGLRPGDRALFSLDLYTNTRLEHAAGSSVLTCSYLGGRNALCDGTVSLADGARFSASGFLDPNTSSVTLFATASGFRRRAA